MKKYVFIIGALLIILLATVFLGLTHSYTFNKFVFSNVVNPYDPLKVSQSQPVKKQLQQGEAWEDPRGLFPIFAYNIPDGTKDLSASLKIIERGGINIIIKGNFSWMPTPYKIKRAFEKLGDSNLQWLAIIENECKDDFIYRNSNNETNSNIKNILNDFNEDYIYGWYVWDEPGRNREMCSPFNIIPNNDNDDINTMVKQIRSDYSFSKKLDFLNLFPSYWDGTPTSEDYENYIDAFFASQEYKPRVLCFDHYPLLKKEEGGFRKDYYKNLEIIREKSSHYNVPFWMIVLSSGHYGYKEPTIEEIRFQVFSALAYGAKGIGYYLYSKSWEHVGYSSWILEDNIDNPGLADSMYGPLFLPVKELNQNVQKIGKLLSKLKCVEVIHSSDYPNNQKEIDESIFDPHNPKSQIQQIKNIEGSNRNSNILIGIFSEENETNSIGKYFLIVNKNVKKSSEIEIGLDKVYDVYGFDQNEDTFLKLLNDQSINLKILPGSGKILLIK